jgi:hypothetical protein
MREPSLGAKAEAAKNESTAPRTDDDVPVLFEFDRTYLRRDPCSTNTHRRYDCFIRTQYH